MGDLYWSYAGTESKRRKKNQVNWEVEGGVGRWEMIIFHPLYQLQKDESKDHWSFNYGVTSELQKKWTTVSMALRTEWGWNLQFALQNSAKISALPLANYVLLSIVPNKTKMYLLIRKIDMTTIVLSTFCNHFTFRII